MSARRKSSRPRLSSSSSSISPSNEPIILKQEDQDDNENTPNETDVLFGSVAFLRDHPGTQQWASVVGSYSQQCYWSPTMYQQIRNDKRIIGKRYFMKLSRNKFRPATEMEIEERTCSVFDHGVSPATKRGRKRKSTGEASAAANAEMKKNATSGSNNNETNIEFQEGDSVYVYDQLWRAKIVEVSDFLDGPKYKVHYMGFLATADNWVDRKQLFQSTEEMKELYHAIDKAEGMAYQGEYDVLETNNADGNADTDGKCQNAKDEAWTKKRKTNGQKKPAAGTATSKSKPNGTGGTIGSKVTNVTQPINGGNNPLPETLSHRLFATKPKAKKNQGSSSTAATEKASASSNATKSAEHPNRPPSSVGTELSQVVTNALEKCDAAKQAAQEAGMTAIGPLMNGEAAKWSRSMLQQCLNINAIRTNLPKTSEMQSQADKWKQEGGLKGLEAMAMEQKIAKWQKAQEHLAKFVKCLVEDL